ncbi:hypothetical protein BpHYR1_051832 [Brachionus plicatilis]|uniref:Uncharacterized protein n=1 Tax=Brachionus plicatilis TaxID=10195 RepID=A0A3M7RTK3_BRAPC|nr:hypothetical protein BpHYR1_051832 [Brachionus plicatilis]
MNNFTYSVQGFSSNQSIFKFFRPLRFGISFTKETSLKSEALKLISRFLLLLPCNAISTVSESILGQLIIVIETRKIMLR